MIAPTEMSATTPAVTQLQRVAELALTRHRQVREQSPERAAAAYLRAALSSARAMAHHAPRHPALRGEALALIDRVMAAAVTAEAALFAAGKNSASYFTILIAAENLRLTIADQDSAPLQLAPPPHSLPNGAKRGNQPQQPMMHPPHPARGVNVLARQRR